MIADLLIWSGLVLMVVTLALMIAFAIYAAFHAQQPAASGEVADLLRGHGYTVVQGEASPAGPFENTALAAYYQAALARANISFWFSLAFAALGFLALLYAGFSADGADLTAATLRFAGGFVVEVIAGLFFAQSRAAQREMGAFFDKLRIDRQAAAARDLVDKLEDPELRDRMRAELIRRDVGLPITSEAR